VGTAHGYSSPRCVPMLQVMRGQGYDRAPGVQELLAPEGATGRRAVLRVPEPSGTGLDVLHRTEAIGPEDIEVVVTPDLVADLHDPTLVISHLYVGPDRRRPGRAAPHGHRIHGWRRRSLTVVLLTAAVVVPLTLIAALSVPPTAPGHPPAPATAPTVSGSTHALHRAVRQAAASSRKAARAEAVGRRARARIAATGSGAPTGMVSPSSALASPAPSTPAAVSAAAARTRAEAPAVERRAVDRSVAAGVRANARIQAAQRRAGRTQSRARARLARASRPGAGPASGTSGGPAPSGA
jgi:hypothetical protein